jgi:asparagine synthase (glutamine-hydrolysing)
VCGIAGFELASGPDEEAIGKRLLAELAHRGPDGGWFITRGGYGLAQTRLAVIDLSHHVTYPMANETQNVWLLFNGEVYDHAKLRVELERSGHRFRTHCDAEVVLHGYEQWGLDCFSRIDGMFALAMWDERTGELILTRDPLGIKPLVHTSEGRFAFASDALALVAAGLSDGQLDRDAIDGFATFGYVPMPATGVSGLEHVEPGVALIRGQDGAIRRKRWQKRPFAAGARELGKASRGDVAEHLAHALDESVRRQLVADVPVGVFLSAGIDSSLVLDSAVRSGAQPVAFTISFQGQGDFDETNPARRFATQLGVRHVARDLRLDFHEALASVDDAYDQPFADASAIATLAVARMAREEVKVALSGTGGDDLFAGYYRHRAHLLLPLMSRMPDAARRSIVSLGYQRGGDERKSLFELARSYLVRLSAASDGDAKRQYLSLLGGPTAGALSTLVLGGRPGERERVASRLAFHDAGGSSMLSAIQAFELQTYLPSDLLTKEDRATMAFGLEGRVPLLGRDLLALAESLDERELITMRTGKRVLRNIAAQRLPRFITTRRKRGFAVPLGSLFRGPWREPAIMWLRGSSSALLEPGRIADELERGRLHPADTRGACVLIAWERRLLDARAKARLLAAR